MVKKVKRKSFWVVFWIMALVGSLAGAGVYYAGEKILSLDLNGNTERMAETVSPWLSLLGQDTFYYWAVTGVVVSFLILGIIIWGTLAVFINDAVDEDPGEKGGQKSAPAKKDFIDQKIEQERKRRLFLHSLAILQREGRLLDFFEEDLSVYEDAQIGAAVRSIQEDCKKAVKKYIDPRPVLEGNEGDTVTIEDGFDIDAITLVGNVAGQPPFNGVIKHPGWRAGKKDVPKLSDIQDPSIMTPAEVEIQ